LSFFFFVFLHHYATCNAGQLLWTTSNE
jgi:hypothetical protein